MDSLRQAQSYLERDPLRYMDMLEPIRRGMVEVTALREDGVLLYNLPGELYMLAADSVESAQALCAGVGEMELAVAHSRETGEYLQKRYGIARCQGCTQAAYLGKEPFPAAQGVEIRPLGQEAFSVVFANYHSFSDPKYIRERLDAGVMRGAFAQGQLLGFIGMHSEGSVGMLEVLPPYRRRGVALALMSAMANVPDAPPAQTVFSPSEWAQYTGWCRHPAPARPAGPDEKPGCPKSFWFPQAHGRNGAYGARSAEYRPSVR